MSIIIELWSTLKALSLNEETNLIQRWITGSISSHTWKREAETHTKCALCSCRNHRMHFRPKKQSLRNYRSSITTTQKNLFPPISFLLLKQKVSCKHVPQMQIEMLTDRQKRKAAYLAFVAVWQLKDKIHWHPIFNFSRWVTLGWDNLTMPCTDNLLSSSHFSAFCKTWQSLICSTSVN